MKQSVNDPTSTDAEPNRDRAEGIGEGPPDEPPGNGDIDGRALARSLGRTVTLIGMMGAGKSAIGRQIAKHLDLPFVDTDQEIEKAAGQSIPEIFAEYGEPYFRDGERRVIRRLVAGGPCVLATGGGAFIDPETRALLLEETLTLWLKADFDVLWQRVSKRSHRPLLKTPDPQGTLKRLIDERYPVYADAEITVRSDQQPKEQTADRVMHALADWVGKHPGPGHGTVGGHETSESAHADTGKPEQ